MDQNKKNLSIGVVLVLSILAGLYYWLTQPYTITTENLKISAAFPSPPTVMQRPLAFSQQYSSKSVYYQVKEDDIEYAVAITRVPVPLTQNAKIGQVLNQYFSAFANAQNAVGSARLAQLKEFDGQVMDLTTNKKQVIHGKFFLTSSGIVMIMAKVKGLVMTQKGYQFVLSLGIEES